MKYIQCIKISPDEENHIKIMDVVLINDYLRTCYKFCSSITHLEFSHHQIEYLDTLLPIFSKIACLSIYIGDKIVRVDNEMGRLNLASMMVKCPKLIKSNFYSKPIKTNPHAKKSYIQQCQLHRHHIIV